MNVHSIRKHHIPIFRQSYYEVVFQYMQCDSTVMCRAPPVHFSDRCPGPRQPRLPYQWPRGWICDASSRKTSYFGRLFLRTVPQKGRGRLKGRQRIPYSHLLGQTLVIRIHSMADEDKTLSVSTRIYHVAICRRMNPPYN